MKPRILNISNPSTRSNTLPLFSKSISSSRRSSLSWMGSCFMVTATTSSDLFLLSPRVITECRWRKRYLLVGLFDEELNLTVTDLAQLAAKFEVWVVWLASQCARLLSIWTEQPILSRLCSQAIFLTIQKCDAWWIGEGLVNGRWWIRINLLLQRAVREQYCRRVHIFVKRGLLAKNVITKSTDKLQVIRNINIVDQSIEPWLTVW